MNKLFAEAIGTFSIVFFGCGAIVVNDLYGGAIGHMGIALCFGLVVMLMIYAVGNISGAHFNPAVTIGFVFAGRMPVKQMPAYILAQITGGLIGAVLLKSLFPEHLSLGTTSPSADVFQTFVMEVILTFILMFVILNVSTGHKEKGIMAGVAIGATVALEAAVGGPVTGASMNPARSIAPAIISGNIQHLWVYIMAPLTGAIFAFPGCKLIQGNSCCTSTDDSA